MILSRSIAEMLLEFKSPLDIYTKINAGDICYKDEEDYSKWALKTSNRMVGDIKHEIKTILLEDLESGSFNNGLFKIFSEMKMKKLTNPEALAEDLNLLLEDDDELLAKATSIYALERILEEMGLENAKSSVSEEEFVEFKKRISVLL